MMTILQIIPSLDAGGAEQACVDVAVGLKNMGHRPIVVSSGGRRVDELEDYGIWHVDLKAASKNPAVMLENALWLKDFIREEKVDIIHARSRAPAWSAYYAAKRAPCGFVTTFHAAYKFSNPFKKLYNSVMARGERVIAISEFISHSIQSDYGVPSERITVIPRGIDLDKYDRFHVPEDKRAEMKEQWAVTGEEPIILMPARMSSIKGQKILIEAMELLSHTEHNNAVAVMIGDDQGRHQYMTELHNMIDQHNLGSKIRIVSHCNYMPAAYSLATMVVAPSLVAEGFGRVPIEAMAMGIPVVASDLGGYAENIANGKTGWLVPPRDAQKLADAMVDVLSQPHEETDVVTAAAQQEVRARYDRHAMVETTVHLYEDVLAARNIGRPATETAETSNAFDRARSLPLPEMADMSEAPEMIDPADAQTTPDE